MDTNQSEFTPHKDFSWRVETVGEEQQTVVVIDNLLENAEQLVDFIVDQDGFIDKKGFYPGVRAPAPPSYLQALYNILPPILEQAFGVEKEQITWAEASFSLVTVPPQELNVIQRIPHFDSNNPTDFAMVHFLCTEEFGGTSFYRHRETGFEYVDQTRRVPFFQSLEAAVKEGREPPKAYTNGDNQLFERLESFDAAFNRMLLYRCTSLHSGNIPPDFEFDRNPRSGRLSVNTFLAGG